MAGLTTTDELMGGLNTASAVAPTQAPNLTADLDSIESKNVVEAPQSAYDKSLVELRAGRAKLDQQIEKLKQGLDRRSALPFDPMWMKIAAGLLKPTKTGSFAESAGYAAENAADAAIAEQKRLEDIEKLKLDLELKGLESKQAAAQMEDFLGYSQPVQIKPAVTTGARGEIVSNEIPKVEPAVSTKSSGFRKITDADIARAYALGDKHGDKIAAIAKAQREATETEQKEYGAVKRFLPILNESTDSLTVKQARELDNLIASNAPDEEFVKFYQKEGILARPKKIVGEAVSTEGLEGPQAKARRAEVEKLTDVEANKNKLELQKGDIKESTDDAKLASNIALSGQQMYNIADNDATKGMFGKLAKKGWDKVFLTALKEPVRVGNTSIGVGNIEELVIMAGGNQDEINAAKQFKKPAAEAELAYTRIYLAKQGAVTEGERAIVRNIMPSISDPSQVVKLKAELLIAKSQFDMQKADLFNQYVNTHKLGTMSDFMNSSEYKKLYNSYAEHTADIANEYMPGSVKDAIPSKTKSVSPSNRERGPLERSILGEE